MLFDFLFSKRNYLVKKFNPIVFNSNVSFSKFEEFTFRDIGREFLDKSNFEDVVFFKYDDVCFNYDKKFYEDLDVKNFVLSVPSNFYGREFAKSCSFLADGEVILEVLSGAGFVLMESVNSSDVNIVKVSRGDFVVIPEDFYFVLINILEFGDFGVFGLLGKNSHLDKLDLENFNGANLFFTKSGFVKNLNSEGDYVLKNFEGDFLGNYSFDKKIGLYREVMKLPEKFKFLNL